MRDLFILWVAFSLTMGISDVMAQINSHESEAWIHDNFDRLEIQETKRTRDWEPDKSEPKKYTPDCEYLSNRMLKCRIPVQKLLLNID